MIQHLTFSASEAPIAADAEISVNSTISEEEEEESVDRETVDTNDRDENTEPEEQPEETDKPRVITSTVSLFISREPPLDITGRDLETIPGQETRVKIGTIYSGEEFSTRLILKFRDADGLLVPESLEHTPEFLQVEFKPVKPDGEKGLYTLDITVPPDAPRCEYKGDSMGEIAIRFREGTEPREVKLPVYFMVVNPM